MPAPYVVRPTGAVDRVARDEADDEGFRISEVDELELVRPGLAQLAAHLANQLGRLARGERGQLPKRLVAGNPAWPDGIAASALAAAPVVLALPLALSRTQDDKGRVRWTLFGASHRGPSA